MGNFALPPILSPPHRGLYGDTYSNQLRYVHDGTLQLTLQVVSSVCLTLAQSRPRSQIVGGCSNSYCEVERTKWAREHTTLPRIRLVTF